jgi:glycerol-3-phosphate dehydrogenase
MGLLDPQTSDGRMIFLLPWQDFTVAGTTDTLVEVTDRPAPLEYEVQWILHELKHYLSSDVNVERGDVLAAWSGIRPLVKDPSAKNTESLVRNHMIHVSPSDLITVAGGKWTTYRQMAEEAVDKSIEIFRLKPLLAECQTEHVPVIGGESYSPSMYVKLIQRFGIQRDVAEHLAHSYGDRAFEVAKLAEPTGMRWPVMGRKLHPLHPYLEAEVKYAIRFEYARTAVDVLARRTRMAFLNANIAGDCTNRVVELMGKELGWDQARMLKEVEDAKEFFMTMGISTEDDTVRSDFNAMELVKYRRIFGQLDNDLNGVLTVEEISTAFDRVGEHISSDELRNIFKQVSSDGQTIKFDEFLDMMSQVKKGRSPKDLNKFNDLITAVDKKIAIERSGGGL